MGKKPTTRELYLLVKKAHFALCENLTHADFKNPSCRDMYFEINGQSQALMAVIEAMEGDQTTLRIFAGN
jgi:hypothetical protein